MAKITVDELVDIAFAVEEGDPIDWAMFREGKESSMKMIAASIIEQFDREEITAEHRLIMLATITKLVVENMILHTKLLTYTDKDAKI
jgi:hypothetical protein